jgi:proteic killer suppression protein
VRRRWSIVLERTVRELQGQPCIAVYKLMKRGQVSRVRANHPANGCMAGVGGDELDSQVRINNAAVPSPSLAGPTAEKNAEGFDQLSRRCRLATAYLPITGTRYKKSHMAIQSFTCPDTEQLFTTGKSARFANIRPAATRKLTQLDAAPSLVFMKMPPGNDLKHYDGAWHVRINQQWRPTFKWGDAGPMEVLIEDPR